MPPPPARPTSRRQADLGQEAAEAARGLSRRYPHAPIQPLDQSGGYGEASRRLGADATRGRSLAAYLLCRTWLTDELVGQGTKVERLFEPRVWASDADELFLEVLATGCAVTKRVKHEGELDQSDVA